LGDRREDEDAGGIRPIAGHRSPEEEKEELDGDWREKCHLINKVCINEIGMAAVNEKLNDQENDSWHEESNRAFRQKDESLDISAGYEILLA